jgi:ribosomal protein S18 acetylase RimI-like enzyme
METNTNPHCSIRIRKAFAGDLAFLRYLAREAFSIYGDYETILTEFFLLKGVYTYVVETIGDRVAIPVGLLMLVVRKQKRREPHFAEIVAIAVEKTSRSRGIGSCMIEFAKQWPHCFSGRLPVAEVHLSVAETNGAGRSFFHRHGFEIFRKEPWTYAAGQKALRMRYILKNGPNP